MKWKVFALLATILAIAGSALKLNTDRQELATRDKKAATRDLEQSAREKQLDEIKASLEGTASDLAKRQKSLDARADVVSEQERLQKRRDDVLVLVQKSAERLRKAVVERDKGLAKVEHLAEVAKSSAARLEPLQKANPAVEWEVRAKQDAIADLVVAREARALRASSDVYHFEAEAGWEIDTLRDLARSLKLPAEVVPANEFELLDRSVLTDLGVRWTAKHLESSKQNATAPGLFAETLAFATAKLKAIVEAKNKPQANLYVNFAALLLLKADVNAKVAGWYSNKEQVREAEIRQREMLLLGRDLANRDNLPAYIRLLELKSAPPADGIVSAVLQGRRSLILSRAHGFSPSPTTATDVRELLRTRCIDPLLAVRCEAKLLIQHKESGSFLDFEEWMARHLTTGQLYEIQGFLQAARERVRLISLAIPAGFQEYVKADTAQIDKEFKALGEELERRGSQKEVLTQISGTPKDVLMRHVRAVCTDTTDDPIFREIYWGRTRLYLARTGPNSEAHKLEIELALPGYEVLIAHLEAHNRKLVEIERDCTEYRKSAADVKEYQEAKRILSESRGLVENGLADLVVKTTDAGKVKALQERVKSNLAAIPPPSKDFKTIGLPYGDAEFVRRSTEASGSLAQMNTKVAEFRILGEHLTEALRVARALLQEYPDLFPPTSRLTEKEKVERVGANLKAQYSKSALKLLGRPDPYDFTGGSYKRSVEKLSRSDNVVYRGRDSLGREKYSAGGKDFVINLHSTGPSL
jgi:hypothetical protein